MWTQEEAARWKSQKIREICERTNHQLDAVNYQYQQFLERLSKQRQQLETITVTTQEVR